MNWGQLLADLRLDMKDTGETPRLDDATAYLYLKFALADYSQWNPATKTVTLDFDNTGMATLPDDFISPIEVRDSVSQALIRPRRGVSNPPAALVFPAQEIFWWIEGTKLRVTSWGDSPDTASLLYKGRHLPPANASATTTALTIPESDERAILLFIRGSYANTMRTKTSQLDRYKRKTEAGNTRQDNPIRPEEDNLMDEYMDLMNTRYGGGSVRLAAPHRR